MVVMSKTQIAPAIDKYVGDLAQRVALKQSIGSSIPDSYELTLVKKLSAITDAAYTKTDELKDEIAALSNAGDIIEESGMIRDKILPKMAELRALCDEAETLTSKEYWPFPSYADLLFGV